MLLWLWFTRSVFTKSVFCNHNRDEDKTYNSPFAYYISNQPYNIYTQVTNGPEKNGSYTHTYYIFWNVKPTTTTNYRHVCKKVWLHMDYTPFNYANEPYFQYCDHLRLTHEPRSTIFFAHIHTTPLYTISIAMLLRSSSRRRSRYKFLNWFSSIAKTTRSFFWVMRLALLKIEEKNNTPRNIIKTIKYLKWL